MVHILHFLIHAGIFTAGLFAGAIYVRGQVKEIARKTTADTIQKLTNKIRNGENPWE